MGCSASLMLPPVEQQYEEIRFLQSSMRNIDKYFYLLHDDIQLQQTSAEVIHIRDGVEKYIRSILKLASLKDSRLRIKDEDLIKVGSFYDRTKLGAADQFDYIAVMSEIGNDGIYVEDLNQPLNGINVKIYVEEKKHNPFAETWDNVIKDSYLIGRKTKVSGNVGLLDIFSKCLRKVSVKQSPVETKFGTVEIDSAVRICTEGPSVKITLTLTKSWHIIEEMKKVDKTSTETVAVNITPAIRWTNVKDFILPDDPVDPSIYAEVVEKGCFLLIPASDGHFQKVFTESEMTLVKELPIKHLKALRVLKYLINGHNRLEYVKEFERFCFRLYDSYSLKMLMIANSDTCPCMNYTEFELFDCVMHVLRNMYESLYDASDVNNFIYPHVFIQSASFITNNNDIIKLNKNSLSELIKHDLKVWIGEKERYDFSGSVKRYGVTPLNFKILDTLHALNYS